MKIISITIIIGAVLISGWIIFYGKDDALNGAAQLIANSNVSIIDGVQNIKINAKGGYFPKTMTAKAEMPTIIKINTQGTFDCSSALVIPDLNYRANLPPSGETVIEVPPQKVGSVLQGLCAMGMYNFRIDFN